MRRLALLMLPLLVVACSKEKANVPITINYTPSFKKGCIQIVAQDEANLANLLTEEFTPDKLANQTQPLKLGVVLKEGWGTSVKVTITARELNCAGPVADREELTVDLSGEGRKEARTVQLDTPDEDGDGYVAKVATNTGTDCDDVGPRAASKFPGNPEVCDFEDNDCDGADDEGLPTTTIYRDGDGDGVGGESLTHCVPVAGITGYALSGGDCNDADAEMKPGLDEVCDDKDNNCVGGVDEGIDKKWYLDNDGDGVPREAEMKTQCLTPGEKYKKYPEGPPFDCDDEDGTRAPGKVEICDNKDNNCDPGLLADETFTTKGASCAGSCGGEVVCKGDFSGIECNKPDPALYYPDVDGDGEGSLAATAVEVCQGTQPPSSPVHVLNRVDCDDADPDVKTTAAEVCDAIDNNCAGGVDEGLTCGGDVRAPTSYHLGGNGHDWRTVSLGGGRVWIAGMGGKLIVRKTAGAKFESFGFGENTSTVPGDGSPNASPNHCGDYDWFASWVDSGGNVYLAGENGRVSKHNGTACSSQTNTGPSDDVRGMVGFENGATVTLYLVDIEGRLFTWVPGANPDQKNDNNIRYYGIHGLEASRLLVAGEGTGGSNDSPRLLAYVNGDWHNPVPHVLSPSNVNGEANAVWMGTSSTACAVGNNGTVWKWDGTTNWTKFDAPVGVSVDFSSVVMLPNGNCYIVDKSTNGKLRRLTQYGWAVGPIWPTSLADKPLHDIAMTSAGDFWVVGDDGRVAHYPEPPPLP